MNVETVMMDFLDLASRMRKSSELTYTNHKSERRWQPVIQVNFSCCNLWFQFKEIDGA